MIDTQSFLEIVQVQSGFDFRYTHSQGGPEIEKIAPGR